MLTANPLLLLFLAVSAGGLWVTRPTQGSGGLLRYLAYELVAGLVLLGEPAWLAVPTSAPQAVSWVCLLAAGLLAAGGLLARAPAGDTFAPPRGLYRQVRHPFHTALLLTGWGLFCQTLVPVGPRLAVGALLLTVASLLLISAAHQAEAEAYLKFGADYSAYVKASKLLVPFLF